MCTTRERDNPFKLKTISEVTDLQTYRGYYIVMFVSIESTPWGFKTDGRSLSSEKSSHAKYKRVSGKKKKEIHNVRPTGSVQCFQFP